MADAAAGGGQAVDVLLVQPHAVAQGQAVGHHAEAVDVLQRRAVAAPQGVFLLVGGLDQVHVHGGVVFGRGVGEQRQRLVGAPVQVGRRKLDLHPALVVMLRVERLEHVHRIVEAHLEAVEPALHGALQLRGQAFHELLVSLVDQPVLVAHGVAVADAHADILVGADGLGGALLTSESTPGIQPWMCCTVVMPEPIISKAE